MRFRDRCYFGVIGAGCLIGYVSGVWLLPLLVLVVTEAVFWIADRDGSHAAFAPRRAWVDDTGSDRSA